MKCSKRSFAVVPLLFAVLLALGIGTLNAHVVASPRLNRVSIYRGENITHLQADLSPRMVRVISDLAWRLAAAR